MREHGGFLLGDQEPFAQDRRLTLQLDNGFLRRLDERLRHGDLALDRLELGVGGHQCRICVLEQLIQLLEGEPDGALLVLGAGALVVVLVS